MRAMLLEEPRRPLRMAEVDTPRPGPGQVRVQVSACGVCRTDLHVLDGELTRPKLPLILGHEIDLVIDIPAQGADHSRDGFIIRRNAIETGVNVLTAMDTAQALITSLENTDIQKLTLIDIATVQ